jgi:short-subunit dehydrogenase
MLKKFDSTKGIVLVGSSSEIGLEILKLLKPAPNTKLLTVGRGAPSRSTLTWPYGNFEEVFCDFESTESVNEALDNISHLKQFDLVIVASGYLPQENEDSDLLEVRKTIRVNGEGVILFLSAFANRLAQLGGGKILLISSVAGLRPRIRNFTYGATKAAADFFAIGLASKYENSSVDIKVLRPGFVFTKMTTAFKPAPFAISTQVVSRIGVKLLRSKRRVAYAPSFLKFLMNVLKIIPRWIFNRL